MNALGSVIFLLGCAAVLSGLVIVVWPIQALGFSQRRDGLFIIFAAFAVMFLGYQVSPDLRQKAAAKAETSTIAANASTIERPVSKSETLHNLRIGGFRWEKDGFGSIMKATFVIYNDNRFPVKDVTVTCTHTANSGSKIDRNTRTLYELVEARGYFSVVDMNMGFIHSAVTSSTCQVTGFSKV